MVARSPLATSRGCRVGLPDLGWEASGDLGVELGDNRDLSGVQNYRVHPPHALAG